MATGGEDASMPPRDPSNVSSNGAAHPPGNGKPSSTRRRIVLAAVVLFVAAWTVALIYSVTAGGRSPERLDDRAANVVDTACRKAQHDLSALTQLGTHPTVAQRAARVASEDQILTAMVVRLRAVHPTATAPATALGRWLDDWQDLIAARQHFVNDLGTLGTEARFVEPATKGVEPIADKMNNWILEQGTRTDSCNTGALQVEVVEGPRVYGAESKS